MKWWEVVGLTLILLILLSTGVIGLVNLYRWGWVNGVREGWRQVANQEVTTEWRTYPDGTANWVFTKEN